MSIFILWTTNQLIPCDLLQSEVRSTPHQDSLRNVTCWQLAMHVKSCVDPWPHSLLKKLLSSRLIPTPSWRTGNTTVSSWTLQEVAMPVKGMRQMKRDHQWLASTLWGLLEGLTPHVGRQALEHCFFCGYCTRVGLLWCPSLPAQCWVFTVKPRKRPGLTDWQLSQWTAFMAGSPPFQKVLRLSEPGCWGFLINMLHSWPLLNGWPSILTPRRPFSLRRWPGCPWSDVF